MPVPFDDERMSSDPEVTTTLLRHALMVWGREHGVAETHLSILARDVLDYAGASLRDGRFHSDIGA